MASACRPKNPSTRRRFTLVSEHPGGRVPLYHFDVYRLPDSSGLYDLAFDEYLSGDGVVVIEWADKITDALPPDRLDIALSAGCDPETRQVSVDGAGRTGRKNCCLNYWSSHESGGIQSKPDIEPVGRLCR